MPRPRSDIARSLLGHGLGFDHGELQRTVWLGDRLGFLSGRRSGRWRSGLRHELRLGFVLAPMALQLGSSEGELFPKPVKSSVQLRQAHTCRSRQRAQLSGDVAVAELGSLPLQLLHAVVQHVVARERTFAARRAGLPQPKQTLHIHVAGAPRATSSLAEGHLPEGDVVEENEDDLQEIPEQARPPASTASRLQHGHLLDGILQPLRQCLVQDQQAQTLRQAGELCQGQQVALNVSQQPRVLAIRGAVKGQAMQHVRFRQHVHQTLGFLRSQLAFGWRQLSQSLRQRGRASVQLP
mmetsp:Transcript_60276/g.197123  ORF Transcript_60276/g.197123 Transcript_60276/m.197123 type:complete len:295 (-) Transcript_60276:1129-2013(-)